jgi:uncharacterized repeat protein (TIGR01451 family)
MNIPSLSRLAVRRYVATVVLASGIFAGFGLRAQPSSLAYASAWNQDQTVPAAAAFSAWAERFSAAPSSAKSSLAAEGLTLARERRDTMAHLIQTDPKKALSLAVPAALCAQLPKEILAEIETRVAGLGDYSVEMANQAKSGAFAEPIRRFVLLNGQKYRAFVYGRRVFENSKGGIPLHGIVIGDLMALHESALRQLDAGETPDATKQLIQVGKAQASGSVFAEMDGKVYQFATGKHLLAAAQKFEVNESALGPYPLSPSADLLTADAQSLDVLQPVLSRGPGRPPPTAWTIGGKKVLVIRVDFPDLTGDPVTVAEAQNVMDTQVAPYYAKSSYAQTFLTNTVTTQLYRMPQPATSYASSGNNDQLHTDAENLAAADYVLANYDRIIVVFASLGGLPGSLITYGGLAILGGKNVWVNGEFDFRVVAHELGHTYGLLHAGFYQVTDGNPISLNGTTVEYGDDFDTMGANYANDQNTDFNAFYKNNLGWINDNQVATITTNGIYRVNAFDWANNASARTNAILAMKMVKDSDRTYWIGVRRNFISNPYMQNGVYMIWGLSSAGAGGGGGYQTDLLDLNTPGLSPIAGLNADYDSALGLGQTFNDTLVRLMVTPLNSGGGTNPWVDIQIGPGGPGGGGALQIVAATNYISGGNGNGLIDVNECNTLSLVLTNKGALAATNVQVSLSTTTKGVVINQPLATYPDLLPGGTGTNAVPFRISTAPDFICGLPVDLTLNIKSDQGSITNRYPLPTGSPGVAFRFNSTAPVFIPDLGTTNSPVVVSNLNFAVTKVTVATYITHTFVSDLVLRLVSPDGTTNLLSANNGGAGQNYGLGCADNSRTVFDDGSTNSIINGIAPFVGSYSPQQPLSVFSGKSGTNVSGVWQLIASDTVGFDFGTIQCWSLYLTPSICTNGGGECPGSDLAVGMVSLPEPAFVGSPLTYVISVTNRGPSLAKTVSVSQTLPSGVSFVSGNASQGAVVHSAGVVTANLGQMSANSTATISVQVLPIASGLASCTATASSEQPDFDLSNNSVTIFSHVNAPTADLAVGALAAPSSILVGGSVTYTISVTNNGPSAAPSGVLLTNVLPAGMSLLGQSVSQGSVLSVNGNTVVFSLGGMSAGGRATATVTARANATGTLVANATVASLDPSLVDPIVGNNSATAVVSVGPAADLALSLNVFPNPVVLNSNVTFVASVTNTGPSAGNSITVNATLPPGLPLVSTNYSQGTVSFNNGSNVVWHVGTLAPGAGTILSIVLNANRQGSNFLATASVSATEADPNLNNNSAAVTLLIAQPFLNIVAAGASLTSPSSGYLDIGQTNVIQFRLQNMGNVFNTNLVVTLQTNASVTPLSGPQTYGILKPIGLPGAGPVSRPFTFISNGTNGGTVIAVLTLKDAVNATLPPVTFTFVLPTITSFANTSLITIPDPDRMPTLFSGPAKPYPSAVSVAGITGQVARVTTTLVNMSHSYPHDINALLVGPTGAKTLLLSHAANASSVSNVTVTFDDNAGAAIAESGSITAGSWQPSAYAPSPVFSNPAPAGPYTASLSTFGGVNPNGNWSLFVFDDSTGDAGEIAQGWSLNLATVTPVNQIADVGITGVATPAPVLAGDALTYTFTISNAGPSSASGVVFSNLLPATVTLLNAAVSQGNYVTNGNLVTGNLATLPVGSNATVTVVVKPGPGAAGQLNNTAYASAFEADLHTSDNHISVISTVNLPNADLAASISTASTNVWVGSNVVYTINVTNAGPGTALSATVSDPLPPFTAYVTGSSSVGSVALNGSSVVATLGDLPAGAWATVTLTLVHQSPGSVTNTVTVATASSDTVSGNNTASARVTALAPAPIIVAVGAALVDEEFLPPNGVVDPGEQVTVSLILANTGVLDANNLTATLLAATGVTQPSGPVSYGRVAVGGASVTRQFTFRASVSAVGAVVATLQLTDGANSLGQISYTFSLPASYSFSNPTGIVIPDHGAASPYPSIINVSGITGFVTKVTVNLIGLSHSFPQDINVLLVNPAGRSTLLMSHNGGAYSLTNVNLTFDDNAPAALSSSGRISSGTNQPTKTGGPGTFPPPAPAAPYASTLSALNNVSPNGSWALYVLDDSLGDSGVIASGWAMNLSTINPVSPLADLALSMSANPTSIVVGELLTYSLRLTNLGPNTATSVVVDDQLPQGFAIVSNYLSAGSVTNFGGVLTWNVGTLASGGSATFAFTAAPSIAGFFLNTASVFGNCTDLYLNNNTAQVSASAIAPFATTLSGRIVGGLFELTVHGQASANYQVLASTNLTSWVSLGVYPSGAGTFTVIDTNTPSYRTRFYRTLHQ